MCQIIYYPKKKKKRVKRKNLPTKVEGAFETGHKIVITHIGT
jgi:hypothetical protein